MISITPDFQLINRDFRKSELLWENRLCYSTHFIFESISNCFNLWLNIPEMKIAESFILKFCFLVCRDQLFDDFGLKTVLFKDFIKCLRVPVSISRRASRWLHNTVGHHLILLWVLVPIRFSWRTFSRFSVLNLIRKIGESSKLIKKTDE